MNDVCILIAASSEEELESQKPVTEVSKSGDLTEAKLGSPESNTDSESQDSDAEAEKSTDYRDEHSKSDEEEQETEVIPKGTGNCPCREVVNLN